jgi:uncharacterized protein YbaR (Trm112 family)
MGRKNNEDDVRVKMLSFGVRLTCYISGAKKNRFLLDQIKRDLGEGELIKNILDIHYAIIDEIPEFKEKEHIELKQYLIDKIKLK